MDEYAVLLRSYAPLPHFEWRSEVAAVLGRHPQTVAIRLRRQQGIVWEELGFDQANGLATFLIEKGFPAGLVAQEDIVTPGKLTVIRNADVVDSGLELESFFADKEILDANSVEFAQVGWVAEMDEARHMPRRGYRDSSRLDRSIARILTTADKIGWVLHLFHRGDNPDWLRIVGRKFNYDYQETVGGSKDERFGRLLEDLSHVVPSEALDDRFMRSIGAGRAHDENVEFEELDDMIERARWELTMRSLDVG